MKGTTVLWLGLLGIGAYLAYTRLRAPMPSFLPALNLPPLLGNPAAQGPAISLPPSPLSSIDTQNFSQTMAMMNAGWVPMTDTSGRTAWVPPGGL